MPLSLRPAPGVADPSHRAVARQRAALAARELTQVRAAALAWSKGMAAVLAGLLGFSLVKGRTDVGSLSGGYALIVGALLLLAIGAGGAATWNLLSAAYGRPIKVRLSQMRDEQWSQLAAEHAEALSAGKAMTRGLRWGIVMCRPAHPCRRNHLVRPSEGRTTPPRDNPEWAAVRRGDRLRARHRHAQVLRRTDPGGLGHGILGQGCRRVP